MDSNFCTSEVTDNLTTEIWRLDGDVAIHGLVFASFLLVFELIGLPWNILVVVTIVKEKLYHQPVVILLLNLIVTNLFILLGPTPILMTTGFTGEFLLGSSDRIRCNACRLAFLMLIPVYNSMFTVALMSLDRFFYIYKPFKYERCSTKYFSGLAVAISIVCSITLGFVSHSREATYFNKRLMVCLVINSELQFLISTIIRVVIGAFVLLVIIVTNVSFSCIVYKNIRAVYSQDDNVTEGTKKDNSSKKQACRSRLIKRSKSKRYQKQRHLCRMLLALLGVSIITLVPMIMILLGLFLKPTDESFTSNFITVVLILHYSQVITYPILETYLITDIRYPMKEMLTCGKLKRKKAYISEEMGGSRTLLCLNSQGKCSFWLAMFEVGHLPSESSTTGTAADNSKKSGDSEVAL